MKKETPPTYLVVPDRNELFINGKEVRLSNKEYRLFVALEQSKKTMSRGQLMDSVWGTDGVSVDTRTVDQHVARLRRKIGIPLIATIPCVGYRFDGKA